MASNDFKFGQKTSFKADRPKVNFGSSKAQNPLEIWAAKQMYEQSKPQQAVGMGQQVSQQFGDNPPPGSTFNYGGVSAPINPKRTVEEAQALAGSDSISRHIRTVKDLQRDPQKFRSMFEKATFKGFGKEKGSVFGIPLTYGDKESGNLKFALDDMANRLIYLQSGKQINE